MRVIRRWQSIANGRFPDDCRALLKMVDETDGFLVRHDRIEVTRDQADRGGGLRTSGCIPMKNVDAVLKRASTFSTQKILVVTRSPQNWGENLSRGCNGDSIGKIFRHVCGKDRTKAASGNLCCDGNTRDCRAKANSPFVLNGERL